MNTVMKPTAVDRTLFDQDEITRSATDILLRQCMVPRELLKFGDHKMRDVTEDLYSAVSGYFTPQGCMCKTLADYLTIDGCEIVPPGDPTQNPKPPDQVPDA